jgi:DNA mismatch repair protein MutS
MKSVGCGVIMAQSGCYVACDSMEYVPYENIFTRIVGEDNIFRGYSSFAVEMLELRTILEFANDRSIVFADELCKGTEDISALSLVGGSILTFLERGIHFMMATHLHRLMSIESIRENVGIRHMHLKVRFDETCGGIIYDRILQEGNGQTMYGLEVARYLLPKSSNRFMEYAEMLRDEYIMGKKSWVEPRKSQYNSGMYMSRCEKCGVEKSRGLHTHHITFQCMFKEEYIDKSMEKDKLYNLVALCEGCHESLHRGEWMIEGWKDTMEGRRLMWSEVEKEKEKEKEVKRESNGKKKKEDGISEEELTFLKNNTKGKTIKWVQLEYEERFGKKLTMAMWKKYKS